MTKLRHKEYNFNEVKQDASGWTWLRYRKNKEGDNIKTLSREDDARLKYKRMDFDFLIPENILNVDLSTVKPFFTGGNDLTKKCEFK